MAKTDTKQLDLSIIIVNWNTADLLDACLKSLFYHTRNVDFEIIVFDNASIDQTREVLSKYPQVQAIHHHENIGFARANNRMAEIARGKYLLMLNPDTEFSGDILSQAVAFLKENQFDILGIRLRLPDGSIQISSGNFLKIRMMIFQNIFLVLKKVKIQALILPLSKITGVPISQLIGLSKFWDPYKINPVDWVSGAFFLLSRRDFREAGKFDESFSLYGEEIELCYRLSKTGNQAVYYGALEILHHSGASVRRFQKKSLILHFTASRRFYQKHRPGWEVFLYRLTVRISYMLAIFWLQVRWLLPYKPDKGADKERIQAYRELVGIFSTKKLEVGLPDTSKETN